MVNKKWQELEKKSNQDLRILEEQTRAELFALRFQHAIGSLEKPHRIVELKKTIARILTLLTVRVSSGDAIKQNLKTSTLKAEYKETMQKMENETDAYREKMEARMKAEQPEMDPAMFDEESLKTAMAEADDDSNKEEVVEVAGTVKTEPKTKTKKEGSKK